MGGFGGNDPGATSFIKGLYNHNPVTVAEIQLIRFEYECSGVAPAGTSDDGS